MSIHIVWVGVVLVYILRNTESFPNGAPIDSCYNFRPGHGGVAVDGSEKNDSKTVFSLSATSESGAFDVVLKAVHGDRPFKGFLIKAIPDKYSPSKWANPKIPIGKWKINRDARRLDCFRGESNVVTHIDNDPKLEANFIWVPPKYLKGKTGNVTFVATVVEHFAQYWTGVATDLMNVP